MKSLGLTAVLLLTLPQASLPQDAIEWGRAYLSFSPDAREDDRDVEPLEPFTFYLIMEFDSLTESVDLLGAEGGIAYAPSLALTQIDWGETFQFDLGQGLQPGLYDFTVTWVPPVPLQVGPNVIGRFTGFLLEETDDVLIEIRAVNRCSFDCEPMLWIDWRNDTLYRAVVTPNDAVMLNRSRVVTRPSSWGRVKALYVDN